MVEEKSPNDFDKILELLNKKVVFKEKVLKKDLDTLIEIVIREIVNLFGAQSITFYLVEKDDKIHFSYVYFSEALYEGNKDLENGYKEKKELLKGLILEKGKGIVGRVIESGKSYLCKNAQKDPIFYAEIDTLTGRKTKTLLTVPLKTENKVYGAIQVIDKLNNKEYAEKDQEMLESVAKYAAEIISKVDFLDIEK